MKLSNRYVLACLLAREVLQLVRDLTNDFSRRRRRGVFLCFRAILLRYLFRRRSLRVAARGSGPLLVTLVGLRRLLVVLFRLFCLFRRSRQEVLVAVVRGWSHVLSHCGILGKKSLSFSLASLPFAFSVVVCWR